ncbi:MAG: polysaccharide biosynthesis protein [Chloroflexi bacterium]|nr:polysaccharide biosynthesis protein [Chloroflexota bacterium]
MLARLLGADGYGAYNLALSLATIGGIVPLLGFDTAIVRYTAIFAGRGDWGAVRANLRLMLSLSAALSLLVTVGLVFFAEPVAGALLHDRQLAPLVLISALMVPTLVLNIQLGSALRGVRRIAREVFADQVFQPVVRLALLLMLVVVGLTVSRALLAWTVASLATTVLLAYLVIRALPPHGHEGGKSLSKRELLRFSGPVFLSNVVSKSGDQLQTLLLGALSTITNVGVFAVATNVNLIGSLVHSSLVSASMPLFAEAQDVEKRPALEKLYQLTSRWSLTLNLPIFLVVVAYAQVVLALFGPEFRSGALPLGILAAANLLNAGTGMSGAVLDMTGHTALKLLNATVSVVLGIALNVILVPSLGLMGAAIAALALTAGVNILPLAEVLLLERASPYNRQFMKPIVAGGLAFFLSIGVKILLGGTGELVQAAAGIPVLFVTYGLVLLRLGIDDDDRLVLRRVRERFPRRRRTPFGVHPS